MAGKGFWSYVQDDDATEGGRIRGLAEDLRAQYEALTTEQLDVFFDKESLGWGDDWAARIDDAVLAATFFIPVVTPRYLASAACRNEFQIFTRKAKALGTEDLILPIIWIDVPELSESDPSDDIVSALKRFNWVDWRELRFEDRASGEYRRQVAGIAARIAAIQVQGEDGGHGQIALGRAPAAPDVLGDDDDRPGIVEAISHLEGLFPLWRATIDEVLGEIQTVGGLAQDATAKIDAADARGRGSVGRLTVFRELARQIAPHAERVLDLGNDFSTQLYDIDQNVRVVLEMPLEFRESEQSAYIEFTETVENLAEASREGLGAILGLTDKILPIEALSRDLRPHFRDIRKGLTMMVEGQEIIDRWRGIVGDSQPH